jgi:hypothetical protein
MSRMRRSYRVGDKFTLSSDALDNYGSKYAEQVFTVKAWYDHYVSVDRMAGDPHGSPGFDTSAESALYGSELPFDLYEWEMVKV